MEFPRKRYVHGAQIDELVRRTDTNGGLYYHQDALGSTVALTDSNRNTVERYSYDVFGAPAFYDALNTPRPASIYQNRFLFTGREYLSDLGLYDYRNRIYSPEIGRFLQTDPKRLDAGDNNIYRYVLNNSVNLSDPSGLGCICNGDGTWTYEPQLEEPDETIYPDTFADCVMYVTAHEQSLMEKAEGGHECYTCDETGGIVVDQECVNRTFNSTIPARSEVGCDNLRPNR